MATSRLKVLSATLLATACAAPSYEVDVEPAGSRLFIDGRGIEPQPRYTAPVPYYGTLALTTVPSPADSEQGMRTSHTELVVVEPVTPWVFPFDFLIELGAAAFGSTTQLHGTTVRPATREEPIVEGTRPAHVDDLRRSAAEFAIRR